MIIYRVFIFLFNAKIINSKFIRLIFIVKDGINRYTKFKNSYIALYK